MEELDIFELSCMSIQQVGGVAGTSVFDVIINKINEVIQEVNKLKGSK